MKGSEFVFAYAHSLYYECHKMNPNQGRSNRDSPDCIKNKKAIINPINKKDHKCFQQAATVVFNYKEIKQDLQRITKIEPFINKFNWKRLNFHQNFYFMQSFWKVILVTIWYI